MPCRTGSPRTSSRGRWRPPTRWSRASRPGWSTSTTSAWRWPRRPSAASRTAASAAKGAPRPSTATSSPSSSPRPPERHDAPAGTPRRHPAARRSAIRVSAVADRLQPVDRAMDLTTFLIQCLNAVQYGLLLFLLASGLTLIFGIMGVINLAHGSFYMLGAYLAYAIAPAFGSQFLVMLVVGALLAL